MSLFYYIRYIHSLLLFYFRATTRRTTTTTLPPFTGKSIVEKEGYDYPTPKLAFTLPPKEKTLITQDVTYLPPIVETTRQTTRKPTTRFTRQTTTKPQFKIVVTEEGEGYSYTNARKSFPPATEKTFIREDAIASTYLPPVAETYLPPVTQRVTSTTRRPTPSTTRR